VFDSFEVDRLDLRCHTFERVLAADHVAAEPSEPVALLRLVQQELEDGYECCLRITAEAFEGHINEGVLAEERDARLVDEARIAVLVLGDRWLRVRHGPCDGRAAPDEHVDCCVGRPRIGEHADEVRAARAVRRCDRFEARACGAVTGDQNVHVVESADGSDGRPDAGFELLAVQTRDDPDERRGGGKPQRCACACGVVPGCVAVDVHRKQVVPDRRPAVGANRCRQRWASTEQQRHVARDLAHQARSAEDAAHHWDARARRDGPRCVDGRHLVRVHEVGAILAAELQEPTAELAPGHTWWGQGNGRHALGACELVGGAGGHREAHVVAHRCGRASQVERNQGTAAEHGHVRDHEDLHADPRSPRSGWRSQSS
jgi:hypothetical protein